jgi:hypothetical protein
MIFTLPGSTRSAWSERSLSLRLKPIQYALAERARLHHTGAMERLLTSNKSSISPLVTSSVDSWKLLRMKRRVGDFQEEAATMLYWLQAETFDRSATNRRLALFAAGEKCW